MSIAFVADCHLANHGRMGGAAEAGLNRRCRLTLDVLDEAVQRAGEVGCTTLIVLGDLFDEVRPPAQLIAEASRILGPCRPDVIDQVVLLVGNHEQGSTAPGDHSLAPLAFVPGVKVVEGPAVIEVPSRPAGAVSHKAALRILCVPFRPGVASEWLPGVVREYVGDFAQEKKAPPLLLALHMGIFDNATVPYLRGASDAIVADQLAEMCLELGIAAALVGNWHDRKRWRYGKDKRFVELVQVGALCPTGFDNPGLVGFGGLALWQKGDITIVDLPGPRFLKLKLGEPLPDQPMDGHSWFVELTASSSRFEEAHAFMMKAQVDGLPIEAWEVVPDSDEIAQAAADAAQGAAAAEKLEDAVAAFIEKMRLPDGVERGAVLEKSRGYLG